MINDIRQRIGSQLAALRKSKGLTQAQLADLCRIRRESIAKIERGGWSVSVETLQQIISPLDAEVHILKKDKES